MKYLGVDYGRKRVGIAISDDKGEFAFPYIVLANDKNLIENIKKICEEKNIKIIVIGESFNYKGSANVIMKEVLNFKNKLEERVKLPAYLEPEFLTSAEAEHLQGKTKNLDASAAALILKSFFEHRVL